MVEQNDNQTWVYPALFAAAGVLAETDWGGSSMINLPLWPDDGKQIGALSPTATICAFCGDCFKDPKHPLKRFCSVQCGANNRRKLAADRGRKPCAHCGKDFYKPKKPSHQYCSKACASAAKVKERAPKTCLQCGRSFITKVAHRQFCSRACSDQAMAAKRGGWITQGHHLQVARAKARRSSDACAYCGVSIAHKPIGQMYCSHTCRANATRKRAPGEPQRQVVRRKCPQCGALASNRTYCSDECRAAYQATHADERRQRASEGQARRFTDLWAERAARQCLHCGASMAGKNPARRYCSYECTNASAEMRAIRSRANKGIKRPPGFGAKISKAQKGKVISPEHRAQIAATLRGRKLPPEQRAKSRAQWEGLTLEERRAKNAAARAAGGGRTSKIEDIVAAELTARGIEYTRQAEIRWYMVDFLLTAAPVVLEADGCYWHSCEECGLSNPKSRTVANRDKAKDTYLSRHGYTVVRIKEHAVRAGVQAAVQVALAGVGLA